MSGKRNIAELLRPLRKRGVRFTRDGTCLLKSPRNITGEVVIPPCVTEIGKGAFFMCTELTGITIPGSVTDVSAMLVARITFRAPPVSKTRSCASFGSDP